MNKALAGDTPDLHTYVHMSSEERKVEHAATILEVFTESYNAYQHGKQAKELKKLCSLTRTRSSKWQSRTRTS